MRRPMQVLEDNFRRPTGRSGRAVGHLMSVQHRSLTQWAIRLMNIGPGDRVLDVGCGSGMAIQLLARRAGHVAGIDYSDEMVALSKSRNAAAVREGRVRIQHGDAMALPFAEESFDHVSAIETFYFWPDPLRGLTEAHRVLRPGGQIAVTLEMSREAAARPTLWQRYFGHKFTERQEQDGLHILSGADLMEMMVKAGFKDETFDAEPRKSLGWVCARARK